MSINKNILFIKYLSVFKYSLSYVNLLVALFFLRENNIPILL